MKRLACLLVVIMMAWLAGCGSSSPQPMTADEINRARAVDIYTPPAITPPSAESLKIVVNKSVNQVARAIEAFAVNNDAQALVLTHTIYKTNNRSKASATIMLNIAEPDTGLDCGRNNFAYYDGDTLVKQWEYDVAVREMVLAFDERDSLSRFMSLVGQANLEITPLDGGRTQIAINIDYVLERKVTAYTARQLGEERVIMPISGISVGKFNSRETGYLEDEVSCVSKGAIERRILEGIKANLK